MSSKHYWRAGGWLLAIGLLSGTSAGQIVARTAALPPLSYVCPMPADADVLEDAPGKCRKCGMTLVPVRLDSKWWCPVHQLLEVHDGPGQCRRDRLALVPVTLSEFWTCPTEPERRLLEPGTCANGSPRTVAYELRAHGDHNPRHGGQFFMAEDQWHHLEGTYPRAGVFRAFFYDNFTKPLSATQFSGQIIMLDGADHEIGSFPLRRGPSADVLEASLRGATLPLKIAAKISFGPRVPPQRFDFAFSVYSKDSRVPAVVTTRAPATKSAPPSAPIPSPSAAATPPAPSFVDLSGVPGALAEALDESALPTSPAGLLEELANRVAKVDEAVKDGNLGVVWVPAMATKTAALALDAHTADLPEGRRAAASSALTRVVTAAWELDAYGDLGNRLKIDEAYERLASALADVKTAYAGVRQ